MNSKERVLTALHHEEPDRVPINYHANPGIDFRLKNYYGLKKDDHKSLKKILGVDFASVNPPYVGPKLHEDLPERKVDMWGVRTRYIEHESGGYWDFCDFPLQNATVEQAKKWPMPSPDNFNYDSIPEQAKTLNDYCVYTGSSGLGCIINRIGKWRTMDQILIDLITVDPVAMTLIERKQNIELEITARTLEAGKGLIDFLWMGEDLSTQRGPMISKEWYRKMIRSWHEKFIKLAKSYDLPVMFHSCGACSWLFDDFIEMGINAVDTLQPDAKDMAPELLKEKYGNKLAFHGCIPTGGIIVSGTPNDVINECQNILEVMMPGGGFCYCPSHALQDNTPTENAVAMYEAVKEFGNY